jgi:uncharacterized membrane protein
MNRLRFLLRQYVYDVDRSLYFRPALMVLVLATLAVALPHAEERVDGLRMIARRLHWAVADEPAAAQVVLGTIAGSVMTVVSIIYSVLIVALSLASTQFSPRILAGFMRDRTSQHVLGLFIGTFTYCLLVLRSTHSVPEPFVPTMSVFGALLLALSCLGSLLFFVHHMAQAIQANYIVDRIAGETEAVIDAALPLHVLPPDEAPPCPPAAPGHVVRATQSGYVQLLAVDELAEIARVQGVTLHIVRSMGQFVPEGGQLIVAEMPLDDEVCSACRDAVDLGPIRTMQDDFEFGLRQIVDIALKAISPAINDPSTAVTCIDHLSRLLGRIARRGDSETVRRDETTGKVLVVLPPLGFARALDLAMNQVRQYGKGDVAVLLRLIRSLTDIADMTERPAHIAAITRHAAMIRAVAKPLSADDRQEVDRRLDVLSALLGATALKEAAAAPADP